MNSYKKTILNNTLSVCLLFSIFFTITFYIERYITTSRESTASGQQYLSSVIDRFDSVSIQAQDLSIMLHANSEFKDYVEVKNVSSYERFNMSMYLKNTLSSVPSNNGVIAVAKPFDNYLLSSENLMSNIYFLYNYGLPADEILELFQNSKSSSVSTPYTYFSSANGKDYFTVLIIDNLSFSEPYCIFFVNDLAKITKGIDKNASILISNDGVPVYNTGNIAPKNLDKIAHGKRVFKYSTIAQKSKSITFIGNLECTLIIPKLQYISTINNHLLFALISFILLFLLSLFISQKVSEKTYSPVKKLMDQIGDIDTDTLENELDAISSAITLLSRNNSKLSDALAKNHDDLKEKFVNDLLRGNLTEEQISYGAELYLPQSNNFFPLELILVDINQTESSDNLADFTSIRHIIKSLFEKEFSNRNLFHFTVLAPSSYCIIVSEQDFDALKLRLQKLLLIIESDLGIGLFSSLSREIYTLKDVPKTFLSTFFNHTSLKSQTISKSVYSSDDISMSIMYSYEIDNDIFTHCLRQEKEKLSKSLDFLVSENFADEKSFAERQPQISVLIYALCLRIFATINLSAEDIFGEGYNIYLSLKMCENAEEYRQLLVFLFNGIVDHLAKTQSIDEQGYCDAMLNFIHKNYVRDISLHDLAEFMNMSQSYVSRLFKKLTNYNFKDYLAKVRIEQATKILMTDKLKTLQEIATAVGFNNVKTFSAIFAKINGVTPTEFKHNHE